MLRAAGAEALNTALDEERTALQQRQANLDEREAAQARASN